MISQENNKRNPADTKKRTNASAAAAKKRPAASGKSAAPVKTASGQRPASGKRPAGEKRPASSARPANSSRPASGARPSGGSRSTGSPRSASSARSANGRQPTNGKRPTGAQRAAESQRRPQPYGKKKKSPAFIGLIVALAVVVVAFAGVGIYALRYSGYDKIMPNVFVAGVDIGGMTREEAKAAIEAELQKNAQQTLKVILPDQELSFSPQPDTIHIDVDSAVEQAYAYGRKSTSPFAISRAIKAAQRHKNEIPLDGAVETDEAYIRGLVQTASDSVSTEMTDSVVTPDEENHTIAVTIGSPGKTLDTEELFTLVNNAFVNSDYTDIPFDYDTVYPATVQLDELYTQMTTEPVNATYNAETKDINPDTPGYVPTVTLDEANTQLATASPGDELLFTFDPTPAEITAETLSGLLFRDTLKSYGSVYASNYGRTKNLELACAAINGTVLNPGDVFSFNDTVGERTTDKGYREAIVYVEGNSVPEAGGGVCQVASTIYYCAMYADLKIIQRTEHQFSVDYVPGGLDATVYWQQLDFQFENSTDYPLKINAYLKNGRCWIELIGTNIDGKYCEIDSVKTATVPFTTSYTDDPSKEQTGYTGYTYTITRRVYDGNGNLIRTDTTADLDAMGHLGTSNYAKRDKVVYSGGGEATASPSPSPSTSPSAEPTTAPTTEPTAPPTTEPTAPPPTTEPAPEDPSGGGDGGGTPTE